MRIVTAAVACTDTAAAIQQCLDQLQQQAFDNPQYLMVQADTRHDLNRIGQALRQRWPQVQLHGATSCNGSMTNAGVFMGAEPGLGLWALQDPAGDYGTACGPLDVTNPADSASNLCRQALLDADRLGETPALVWISSAPGMEEAVIAGIQTIVGSATPIVGGSAADNDIQGHWQVIAQGPAQNQGLVVSVLFPSGKIGAAFHSGYSPTEHRGRISRCQGRRVFEIDGRPAASLYAEWTQGDVQPPAPGQGQVNVLMQSSLWPLGRPMEQIGGTDLYLLSHPETLAEDGSMTLFTEVAEGEELVLMTGSLDTLVQRPLLVAQSACRQGEIQESALAGMILVFCAGCMLAVKDRMGEIQQTLNQALPGVPFIAAFTFGEQGPVLACHNRHGNLMISAVMLAVD